MQVILREDVDKLGHRGEVVKVADGYGRNYLLPRGLAVEITPGNLKQVEHEKRALEVRQRKEKAGAEGLRSRLESLHLTIARKAGEEGTLFGSVTNADVAEALAAQGLTVDRRKVVLEEPIKAIGQYSVRVKLHRDVQGEVKVSVVQAE